VKTARRKALAAVVLLVSLSDVLAWCAVTSPSPSTVISHRTPVTQLEKTLRRVPAHISDFSTLWEQLALPKCGNIRLPEALLTPDVSFIVGADGHVYSAFVLDSGGPGEDQIVLRAVRFWRYRPALCNGVPIDSEAQVRFRIR
jgi:TonB family protein